MIATMDSQGIPVPDRFEWWCEQVAKDVVPTVISSPHARDFRAAVTLVELGPVQLSLLAFPELRSVRTPALVRRSDPERYGLSLITAHHVYFAQRGRDCKVGAGELLLHDTSGPSEVRTLPGDSPATALILHLPKDAVPLRSRRLDDLVARPLTATTGMNGVLARYVTSVAAAVGDGELGERDLRRLGEVALDLTVAAFAAQIDAEDELSPETRRQALLVRIDAFIEHNLGDPDLTPAEIAAHHHISVGHLHRLFRSRELTATAWIRHQRLERCRADLADPRLQARPVQEIAARWGFRHPADFSRAFRVAHGLPPGDYRRRALAANGTATAKGSGTTMTTANGNGAAVGEKGDSASRIM